MPSRSGMHAVVFVDVVAFCNVISRVQTLVGNQFQFTASGQWRSLTTLAHTSLRFMTSLRLSLFLPCSVPLSLFLLPPLPSSLHICRMAVETVQFANGMAWSSHSQPLDPTTLWHPLSQSKYRQNHKGTAAILPVAHRIFLFQCHRPIRSDPPGIRDIGRKQRDNRRR